MITKDETAYSGRSEIYIRPLYYRTLNPGFKTYKDAVKHILTFDKDEKAKDEQDPKTFFDRLVATFDDADTSKSIGDTSLTQSSYMDTSIGGNEVMNPYPAFNFDDDIIHEINEIPALNRPTPIDGFRGLGRVYKEVYQDQQKILWLTFGVPQFNDPMKYYSKAGNYELATAVASGGDEDFNLLKTLGSMVTTAGKIIITIEFFPIVAALWLGKKINDAVDFVNNDFITKYYDFKPATIQYYKIWNGLLAELAVSQGLYSGETSAELNPLSLPEVLKDGPDIFAILNKRNKLMTGTPIPLEKNSGSVVTYPDALSSNANSAGAGNLVSGTVVVEPKPASAELLGDGAVGTMITETAQALPPSAGAAPEPSCIDNFINNYLKAGAWKDTLKRSAQGADQFVGFRIEKSTDSSESLNNNSGPSALASTLNNAGKTMKDYKFIAPETTSTIGAILGEITSSLSSLGGSVTDSATTMIFGNGLFDMPDIWQDSSFTKNYSFSVEFNSRLGDPISIFQNYIGMLGLISGSMPRAIGTNMYTSPFICQAYCQGMFAIPLGMIDSLTIRRGSADYGWNVMSLPNTINVSFTIKDLSPMMFLAIAGEGTAMDALKEVFTNNSVMHEYMATLSGMGLSDRKRFGKRLKRRWDTFMSISRSTTFNPTYWAMEVGNWRGVRTLGTILGAPMWPKN